MNHHPHLEGPFLHCFVHYYHVPTAVWPVAAAVRSTLKAVRVLEHHYILCQNITPTLWLWLLKPRLLPFWISIITRRGPSIVLLGLKSRLLIAAGIRLSTLVCTARVRWNLVEGGLRGI
jgi:hypothetical protein